MMMSVEQSVGWQGKLKYSQKTCPKYGFVHHKSHLTGLEPWPPRYEAGD
jgi:hypothetical protein